MLFRNDVTHVDLFKVTKLIRDVIFNVVTSNDLLIVYGISFGMETNTCDEVSIVRTRKTR